MIAQAKTLAETVGIKSACNSLDVSRATYYRREKPKLTLIVTERPSPPLALSEMERNEVAAILDSPRFADRAPAAVYAELLDDGRYLCSIRTMYRLLAARNEVRERRAQVQRPVFVKPELLATAPNQLWSWDISVPQEHRREFQLCDSLIVCSCRRDGGLALRNRLAGADFKPPHAA